MTILFLDFVSHQFVSQGHTRILRLTHPHTLTHPHPPKANPPTIWQTNALATPSPLSKPPTATSSPGVAQTATPARSWPSGGARSVATVAAMHATPQRHESLAWRMNYGLVWPGLAWHGMTYEFGIRSTTTQNTCL